MNEQTSTNPYPRSVQAGIPKLGPPPDGWNTYKFGDVLRPIARPVKLVDDQQYQLVKVKRSRGGVDGRSTLLGKDISVRSQFLVKAGDFLISRRQISHGACGLVPPELDGAIVSNEYSVLQCAPELDRAFLQYLTHSIYVQQTFFHSSIGVHIEKLVFKLDDWLKRKVHLPTLPEQQKIAAFLGAVDDKIDALRRKHVSLKQFKSGLMQKLFSQELRFKRDDGSDFPDWEEKRFSAIAGKVNDGFDPRVETSEPIVIELENLESDTGRIVGHSTVAGQSSIKSRFQSGDVLFGKLRPYLRKFARPHFDGVCSTEIWVLRGKKISNDFLFQLVQSNRFSIAATISSGSKMPRSDWSIVSSAEFSIPSDPDEQQKIAGCLSAVDAKIEAVEGQITQMEAFKKGLLQKMFV